RSYGDWSSDVCSSDLVLEKPVQIDAEHRPRDVSEAVREGSLCVRPGNAPALADLICRDPSAGEACPRLRERLELSVAVAHAPTRDRKSACRERVSGAL